MCALAYIFRAVNRSTALVAATLGLAALVPAAYGGALACAHADEPDPISVEMPHSPLPETDGRHFVIRNTLWNSLLHRR